MSTSVDCIICAFSIDGVERLFSFGVCNHNNVCSICFLKLRSLQSKMTCPECKTQLDQVIATNNSTLKWQDFNVWGEDIGPEYQFDHKSQMHLPREYYNKVITKLFKFQCIICAASRRDSHGLKKHYSEEHNMKMCSLCLDNKQSFPSEQRAYTVAAFDKHLKEGDKDGSIGHPLCEFCKQRYYDREALFIHLRRDHQTCFLCENSGIQHRFYKDYKSLEDHFRKKHYICENYDCLSQHYIVFRDSIDLSSHMIRYHPNEASRNVPIHFKIRRSNNTLDEFDDDNNNSNIDNSKRSQNIRFEGGVGGRMINGEWQVQLPVSSRDPRELQRELEGINLTEVSNDNATSYTLNDHSDEYPALAPSNVPVGSNISYGAVTGKISSQSTVSKFNRNIIPKKEDFPSLPSTTSTIPKALSTSNIAAFNGSVKIKEVKEKPKPSKPVIINVNEENFPTLSSSIDNTSVDETMKPDLAIKSNNTSTKSNKSTKSKSTLESMMVNMGMIPTKKKTKNLISVVKTLSKNKDSVISSNSNVKIISKSASENNLVDDMILAREVSTSSSNSTTSSVKITTEKDYNVSIKSMENYKTVESNDNNVRKIESSYNLNTKKDTRYDNVDFLSSSNKSNTTTLASGIKLTNGGWVTIGGAPKPSKNTHQKSVVDEEEFLV